MKPAEQPRPVCLDADLTVEIADAVGHVSATGSSVSIRVEDAAAGFKMLRSVLSIAGRRRKRLLTGLARIGLCVQLLVAGRCVAQVHRRRGFLSLLGLPYLRLHPVHFLLSVLRPSASASSGRTARTPF